MTAARRDAAPQIFTGEYYQRLYELEERHWWSIGMRAIAAGMLTTRVRNSRGLRILDAGCGTGATLGWLSRLAPSAEVVGIDYSRHALDYCRRRHRPRLAQASVSELPFADAAFDVVVCADVVQHLPRDGSDRTAIREFYRTLRPGGVLFLRTNVHRSRRGDGVRPAEERDPNYHQYSRREIVDVLAGAGFAVRRISYANMLPALAEAWGRRLTARRGDDPPPGANPGLRLRVRSRWLNTVLRGVLAVEAWYLTRCAAGLPYGHSLVCLAAKTRLPAETTT